MSVDHYSGRLRQIDGRERGPVVASARARRSNFVTNPEISSDATENFIHNSDGSPETIDIETRDRLERELNEQEPNVHQQDTTPGADCDSHRPSNFHDTNSYRASTHFNDTNSYLSGSSQMGGSNQHGGTTAPIDASNQTWEELTHAIGGGPENPELLKGFLGHIAHHIWNGNVSNSIPDI